MGILKNNNVYNQKIVIESLKNGKTQEQKEIMERKLSCVKILIESTLTKYFLDSLDFFIKVNHENTKDFLDYLLTLDTKAKQTH